VLIGVVQGYSSVFSLGPKHTENRDGGGPKVQTPAGKTYLYC